MLTGLYKEIKPNSDDVGNVLGFCVSVNVVLEDAMEDCGWQEFDAI